MSTTSLGDLPPELFTKIIKYSLSHREPDYNGWLHTRLVSRAFKGLVEQYFVDHYLKYTSLAFEYRNPRYKEGRETLTDAFFFEKLDENDGRLAIFLLEDIEEKYHRLYGDVVFGMIDNMSNCRTEFILLVRRIVTDVPPIDLGEMDHSKLMTEGKLRLSFDWRSTMTIVMAEEKANKDFDEIFKNSPAVEALKQRVSARQMSAEDSIKKLLQIWSEASEDNRLKVQRARRRRLILHRRGMNKFKEELIQSMVRHSEAELQERIDHKREFVDDIAFSDEELTDVSTDEDDSKDDEQGSSEDWETDDDELADDSD